MTAERWLSMSQKMTPQMKKRVDYRGMSQKSLTDFRARETDKLLRNLAVTRSELSEIPGQSKKNPHEPKDDSRGSKGSYYVKLAILGRFVLGQTCTLPTIFQNWSCSTTPKRPNVQSLGTDICNVRSTDQGNRSLELPLHRGSREHRLGTAMFDQRNVSRDTFVMVPRA